jgi:histidinol dehydrogenase
VDTFGKYVQVQRVSRDGLSALRAAITTLAEAEGLSAHGRAVEVRFDDRADR